MTVNDKQMSAEVHNRYKTKYSRFANGIFSYGDSENVRGIHMSRSRQ
jgi:hypothetical protein